jgi:hypothetical protein
MGGKNEGIANYFAAAPVIFCFVSPSEQVQVVLKHIRPFHSPGILCPSLISLVGMFYSDNHLLLFGRG